MKKTTAVVMAVVTGADTVEAAVDTEVEEEEVDTEGVVAACRDQVEGDGEVDLSRFCQEVRQWHKIAYIAQSMYSSNKNSVINW